MNKSINLNLRKIILSLAVFALFITLSGNVKASAYPIVCVEHGQKHIPSKLQFAKVAIDGESNYSNFTRAFCACGAEVFYDSYSGRYFYTYYGVSGSIIGTGPGGTTVYKVSRDAVRYNYGYLNEWRI